MPILPDGNTTFVGGQNAGLRPSDIQPNQYFIGINLTTDQGSVGPRWGLQQDELLNFSNTGNYRRVTGLEVPFEQIFRGGKFQAFIPYSIGPDYFVIYIVSGFIFLINTFTKDVVVLNPTDALNFYADRINWSNAGNFLVIFDFPNNPFILEGIQIKRADPALFEVPISVMGTYNQNRLCIANAGIDWTAGDPSGSLFTPDAPVTFQEIIIPSAPFVGDVYQVPTANKNNDSITAMGFLQVLDTSTGIGPLLVATSSAIYSYRTDLPRTLWQGGSSGAVFGSALLKSVGIAGQRAHANIGSDLLFVAPSGQIYALSMARNDQTRWGNSPISREVNNFLESVDPTLHYVSAVANHKNKIFFTCNPYRTTVYSPDGFPQSDYVNAGVVVIETDTMASLGNQSPPVWAGLWTGTGFLDFAENNGVLYVAGKYRNRNELYILDPKKTYDTIEGKTRFVRSVMYTKEYTFTDPTINKVIHSVELGLRGLEEKIDVNIEYKTSTSETFNFWRHINIESPVEQCEGFPVFPNSLQPQGIRDLNAGGVEKVCDPAEQVTMDIFKGLQLRFIITGKDWELQYLKLKAEPKIPEQLPVFGCDVREPVRVPVQCFNIWEIPDNGEC